MIITYTPVGQTSHQCHVRRQGCTMGFGSYLSPTIMIINRDGRPPEPNGASNSNSSTMTQSSDQETDPIATQIPDEAQNLLAEVLSEVDSE